jgi:hypothetical protein
MPKGIGYGYISKEKPVKKLKRKKKNKRKY